MTSGSPAGNRPSGTGRCPRPDCTGRLIGGVCDTCGQRATPAAQPGPSGPSGPRQQFPAGYPQQYGSQSQPHPGQSFPAQGPPSQGFPAQTPQAQNPPSQPFPAQGSPSPAQGARPGNPVAETLPAFAPPNRPAQGQQPAQPQQGQQTGYPQPGPAQPSGPQPVGPQSGPAQQSGQPQGNQQGQPPQSGSAQPSGKQPGQPPQSGPGQPQSGQPQSGQPQGKQPTGPQRVNPAPGNQPSQRQPAPAAQEAEPALAAPAPTSVVRAPAAIPAVAPAAAAASPANLTPAGQPLKPNPALAQQHRQTPGWTPPDQVEDLPPGSLSLRLSGSQDAPPAPTATRRVQPQPTVADQSSGRGSGPSSDSRSGPQSSSSRSMTGRGSRSARGSRRSTSRRIGGGLVEVPRVPYRDPASAIMTNPEVPENKRYCGNCQKPVGRGQNGRPGSPDGECPNCGTRFSFRAKLHGGDVIGGQYEVLGALAHGGLGWIYLAKDRNVNDRWVVLKGLIDTGDTAAMAAAVAEKRFLAQVEHTNIVKIYNFVEHPDPETGHLVGYIVMEYVGGDSLRQIALAHKDADNRVVPLPLPRVLAYGLEVLPALGYLHSVGLIYSDLKPDNVIQTDAQVKLIDLGAVRHMEDMTSPIFFTSGYSAPEIASEGPSIVSDIYTVGRTLAVLSYDFTGYTGEFKYNLPPVEKVPLFALFPSYYRLLRRATHPEPDRRFQSCEDMSDQLTGVLREVLALSTREPRPGLSAVFGPEVRTFGAELADAITGPASRPNHPDWAEIIDSLPVPQVDTDDPAAGLVGGLAGAAGARPHDLLDALRAAPPASMEAKLWRARAYLELGDLNQAARQLQEAATLDAQGGQMPTQPYDWRISWFRGLLSLAARRPRDARLAFEHVYDMVPGELAPKLALAISAEACADYFAASRLYELVWRTDRSYVSAAFGLARAYLAQGDRSGALEVLESVPDRSSHFLAAQMGVIAIRTRWTPRDRLSDRDLLDAGERVAKLNLDAERRAGLSADVLQAAVDWVRTGVRPPQGVRVLGYELSEKGLRFGLETCFRSLARLAGTPEERIALVDKANTVRPRTLT